MKFKVHQLNVKKDNIQEKLEKFLNDLSGDVVSVMPFTSPSFQLMGATSKVDFLIIIEKRI